MSFEKSMEAGYVIGIDFGTDSVRALLVNAADGKEISSAVEMYPRWKKGMYCNTSRAQYRQHPLDYIECMERAVRSSVAAAGPTIASRVKGIAVDTTGSTPGPVNEKGLPLALLPEFSDDPDAMFVLWKDHTAQKEAEEINEFCGKWEIDYSAFSGGVYSAEWFWSKILHITRKNRKVKEQAFSWTEHCDWIPALLTGITDPLQMSRSRSAAGHKAMWHESFGGLPDAAFLSQLDPYLGQLRSRLYRHTSEADKPAGILCKEWAATFGLPEDVVVAAGALDAHVGAVGAYIEAYTLVKVVGTSTCDMVVAPLKDHVNQMVKGICGQVDGSVLPGMLGLEAGQSAFGDLYQWYVQLLSYPLEEAGKNIITKEQAIAVRNQLLSDLNIKAAALPVTEKDVVALDWINGRRTPEADHSMKAAISGLHLGSDSGMIFKSLVEATAFGAKAIVERFEEQGVPIKNVIAVGGISKKSPFVMQTLSNVLNRSIKILHSDQVCALGAAMFAATACGIYPSISEAQKQMNSGVEMEYHPEENKIDVYQKLFSRYRCLGEFMEREVACTEK